LAHRVRAPSVFTSLPPILGTLVHTARRAAAPLPATWSRCETGLGASLRQGRAGGFFAGRRCAGGRRRMGRARARDRRGRINRGGPVPSARRGGASAGGAGSDVLRASGVR